MVKNNKNPSIDIYSREIKKVYRKLSNDEEYQLYLKIKKGDRKAVNQLVYSVLPFTKAMASQFISNGIEFEDLICAGNLGLLHAAKLYDGRRGFRFYTYALWWIRHHIIEFIIRNSRIVRLTCNVNQSIIDFKKTIDKYERKYGREPDIFEIANENGIENIQYAEDIIKMFDRHVSLDRPCVSDDGEASPLIESFGNNDNEYNKFELNEFAVMTINALEDEREKEIMTERYINGLTLQEVGSKLKISRERVRQLESNAIENIKKHLSRCEHMEAVYA